MTTFTIITSTYNAENVLPRLLESLATQTYRDFELIIQDGDSKDNTVAIAESWRDKLPNLSLVSEKDTGIYDAWNKALDRVHGEWVIFLGADDMLAKKDVFAKVFSYLPADPSILFLGGEVSYRNNQHIEITRHRPDITDAKKNIFCRMPLYNPATFYRATLFEKQKFDTSYVIAGDYDFMSRVWSSDNIAKILGIVVTNMYNEGISSIPQNQPLRLKECFRIGMNYHNPLVLIWKLYIPHPLRSILQDKIARFCKKNVVLNFLWIIARSCYRKFCLYF